MNVVLLNSPWVNNEKEYGVKAGTRWAALRQRDRSMPYFPFPYFMASTAAYLRKQGFEAHMKDAVCEEISKEQCLCDLETMQPDLIVIETFTPSIYDDLDFAKAAKERFGSMIALCGAHPAALADEMMQHPAIDFVLIGEYDEALKELCEQLSQGEPSFSDIPGIVYRDEGEIYHTHKRTTTVPYDEIPLPDRDELPVLKYTEPLSKYYPTARIVSSRGCPHYCTFCVEPFVSGRNYRRRSLSIVVDEIKMLQEKYGVKEIFFDDAIFTIPRAKEIAKALIEHQVDIAWSSWMDWRIGWDDLKLLKASGCIAIKFGVESASANIRETIGKGHTVYIDNIKRLIRDCKKLGILTHASFMLGAPGETKQSMKETMALAFSLGLNSTQWSIATPLPGTEFYEQAVKEKWLVTDDWRQFEGLNAVVVSYPECSPDEIRAAMAEVHRRKVRQFFRNPVTAATYIWKVYRLKGFREFQKEAFTKGRFVLKSVLGK